MRLGPRRGCSVMKNAHLVDSLSSLHRHSTAEELRAAYEQDETITIDRLATATGRSPAWVRRRLQEANTPMRPKGRRAQTRTDPTPSPTPAPAPQPGPGSGDQRHTSPVPGASATVHHHLLTQRLRELRAQAELTQLDVARAVRVSEATIMRAETPQASLTLQVLHSLCTLYAAPQPVRDELVDLWRQSRAPEWWARLHLDVPKAERLAVGLRGDARRVYGWSDRMVPELLQTAGYARAIERLAIKDEAAVEMAVSVRLALQRRVRRRGIDQHYAIDETILRKWCGGTQAMAEQLTALRALAARGRLRVLSHASGHFFESPFELCSVPGLADEALYFPGIREIHIGDPPPPTYSLRFLRNALERLWGWAEDTPGSVALIDDAHARLLAAGPVPATATT
ncbi:Scr1 family TA system antitoxin-like transcriptional regulator [Nocardiopsis synnemataformans]|uniref:Scr1 family TA system antitoxin-like transcriptional regulator n=1 Tax=Nocardiopsis synnemataformans TaxID=61305 RepID=UPI003EB88935